MDEISMPHKFLKIPYNLPSKTLPLCIRIHAYVRACVYACTSSCVTIYVHRRAQIRARIAGACFCNLLGRASVLADCKNPCHRHENSEKRFAHWAMDVGWLLAWLTCWEDALQCLGQYAFITCGCYSSGELLKLSASTQSIFAQTTQLKAAVINSTCF